MNCKECRRLLEDYHDGELREAEAAALRSHLEECSACAGELDVLKAEHALFQDYRRNQESETAQSATKWETIREGISRAGEWTGISQRRAEGAGSHGLGWLRFLAGSPLIRQAVFATLLVGVSVVGTLIMVNLNREKAAAPVTTAPVETVSQPAPVSLGANSAGLESAMRAVRRAEEEYIHAIQLLSEIVDRRKPSLDPEFVRTLERNLKTIDENIAATRKAYYERPSDPELGQFMLAAYSKKVELLQELAI